MIRTFAYLLIAFTAALAEWTKPVEVLHDEHKAMSYRARWSAPYLIVEASLEPGWHTFSMDNNRRAAEKLAGRPSLGNDLPTSIEVSGGLEVDGPWYQRPPKDFSKPDLQWYSFGFEKEALFVAKVRRTTGAGPAKLEIRGQACTEKICKGVDVEIAVPLSASSKPDFPVDLTSLVRVVK
jgi:DsbC/DsbD-like thiol-disulfide interchange protein